MTQGRIHGFRRPVEGRGDRALYAHFPAFRPLSLWRVCVLGFVVGTTLGCYVYTPVAASPLPGSRLALELNDRGRVGLGESIGSAATSVEGVLQSDADSAYRLKVVSVGYLNGQSNQWSGEPLVVSKQFVKDVRARQFSRSRTFLTAATLVAGAVVFIASRGLFGFGSSEKAPGPGEGGQS